MFRPYLLTEPEEKIITEKAVSGVSAWSRLYEEVLGAIRVDLDGEPEPVALETAMAKLYRSDRDERRGAAEAVTVALQPTLRTRTSIFNTILVDKWIDDRLRGYPTWITSRNLANETSDDAVQALDRRGHLTLRRAAALLPSQGEAARPRPARALRPLRARRRGRVEDAVGARRAASSSTRTASFSSEAGAAVERFFDDGWIDAPVRPDKRHGAYCATNVPGVHPYVFMNYTGDRRSILTLAHELGHALHGSMAQPLGLFNASTPLTTAETASVFGEALTFKRLLAAEDDPRRRLDLLTGQLEDAIATTFRQIAMNRFENLAHTERREQGELSPDRLSELWIECQTALFGDSVGIEGYDTWWSYIPHFMNTPGYVYAYAYGYLFALAIFRSYQREGDAIVAPYLDLLRAGGSKSPEELARMVGLDLTDPSIWASGIEAIADDLDEAEALAAEIGLG